MTGHLLRLIWNRKRQNFPPTVEILLLVPDPVRRRPPRCPLRSPAQPLGSAILLHVERHRRPKGGGPGLRAVKARHRETYGSCSSRCAKCPRWRVWLGSFTGPYANSEWGSGTRLPGGRQINYGVNRVTDDFSGAFPQPNCCGRWFSRRRRRCGVYLVVVNQRLARPIFGDADRLAKSSRRSVSKRSAARLERKPEVKRVIGVIDESRQNGELATAESYMFQRMRLDDLAPKGGLPDRLYVRLRAGTPPAFEEALVKRAMAVAGDWSFEVQLLDAIRRDKLRQYTIPLGVFGTIPVVFPTDGRARSDGRRLAECHPQFGLRRGERRHYRQRPNAGGRGDGHDDVDRARRRRVPRCADSAPAHSQPPLRLIPAAVFVASIFVISVACIYLLTLACGSGYQPHASVNR